jgi:hypothetical protein
MLAISSVKSIIVLCLLLKSLHELYPRKALLSRIEARLILQHPPWRTLDSKGYWKPVVPVWFWLTGLQTEGAAEVMRACEHHTRVAIMAGMIAESRGLTLRNFASTHSGLNQSVKLTESSYQQASQWRFRIILASRYEMVSNMTLA